MSSMLSLFGTQCTAFSISSARRYNCFAGLFDITDEESFLQEASSVSMYEAFIVSITGTSPRHVQKYPGR